MLSFTNSDLLIFVFGFLLKG